MEERKTTYSIRFRPTGFGLYLNYHQTDTATYLDLFLPLFILTIERKTND